MARILIVDDVKTDRLLLGKVVQEAGHHPFYAEDGVEGLAQAKKEKPALIFLDVVMPNSNGFDTCRKLKQDPETKGIPVVLVTSKGTPSDKFWGKRQGADEHIPKPFTSADVVAALQRFLQ